MSRMAAVLTLALAACAAWAPASLADPPEAGPAQAAPPARTLYASPLVTIEQIGAQGLGVPGAGGLGVDGTDGADHLPLDLQDPNGFTTFPDVAPPDGGGLVTVVE